MTDGRIIESSDRAHEILGAIKNVFTNFGIPFKEHADEEALMVKSALMLGDKGDLKVILQASIDIECKAVQIFLEVYEPIPSEKSTQVNRLMGILNGWSVTGHLFTYDDQLYYHSTILIRDSGFNKEEFEKVFAVVYGTGPECCSLIKRVIDKDEDAKVLLGELFSKMFES